MAYKDVLAASWVTAIATELLAIFGIVTAANATCAVFVDVVGGMHLHESGPDSAVGGRNAMTVFLALLAILEGYSFIHHYCIGRRNKAR